MLPAEVEQAYKVYTKYVSPAPEPISLAACRYLWGLLDECDSYCDWGSGFSSFLGRYYKKHVRNITVATLEDNPHWFDRTVTFLDQWGLDAGKIYLWPLKPKERFSLVVYDFGDQPMRVANFETAYRQAKKFFVFDDAHHYLDIIQGAVFIPETWDEGKVVGLIRGRT